jgi:aspartate racemase
VADFLAIPCNAAHIGLREITEAAGCPVLSMIDVTLDAVARRGARRVGVLGFGGASPLYLDGLERRGVRCDTVDAATQAPLDAAIRAVMEGRDGAAETDAALAAVKALRTKAVEAVVLGCTEIPLLLREAGAAEDLVDPAAVLAEAAVRRALA